MMARERHPKREVEEALVELERCFGVGVDVRHHGHVWARMYCACRAAGHQASVASTPEVPANEARRLRAVVARWDRQHGSGTEEAR